MKKTLCTLMLLAAGYSQSQNATISLYKDNYGLVRQPITLQLEPGENLVTYPYLPDKLEPGSTFLSVSAGEVLYQKHNRNTFDTFSYLKDRLGKSVAVKTTEGKSVKGKLVDVDKTWLSVKSRNSVHVVNLSEVIEIISGSGETDPSVRTSMEWTVRTQSGGSLSGEIIYIAGGFDWNANYRLVIAPDEGSATLISQAAVFNNTDQDYVDASIELVEGDLKRKRNGVHRAPRSMSMSANAQNEATFELESSGDFVLYSLPSSVILPRRESVTLSLYPDREVKLERTYLFENDERSNSDEPLAIEFSFFNGGGNLDIPLPAGIFQIYQRTQSGGVVFAGEDILPQTSVGEGATVVAGRAFNVLGKRTVMNYDRKKKSEEATILLQVTNKRDDEVTVRLTEHIFGDWVIREPSHDYRKVDAETIQFDLTVEASSSETVTYTFRKEWQ